MLDPLSTLHAHVLWRAAWFLVRGLIGELDTTTGFAYFVEQ